MVYGSGVDYTVFRSGWKCEINLWPPRSGPQNTVALNSILAKHQNRFYTSRENGYVGYVKILYHLKEGNSFAKNAPTRHILFSSSYLHSPSTGFVKMKMTMHASMFASVFLLLQQTQHVTPFTIVTQPTSISNTKMIAMINDASQTSSSSYPVRKQQYRYRTKQLFMGLYDEDDDDLPELPSDLTKNRRKRDDIRNTQRKKVNPDLYLPDEKDEFGKILPDSDISSSLSYDEDDNDDDDDLAERKNLFEWNPNGSEKNGRLPDLKRTLYDGIPCYFEPGDKKSRIVMEKTECTAHDACWALEANEGKIIEAVLSIAMAQREVLNESVALPGKEEVANADWDAELRKLNASFENEGGSKRLGEEFENAGRSIGFDGLQERKQALLAQKQRDQVRRMIDPGTEDQEWLPGKPNPNPVDDEPWFTG